MNADGERLMEIFCSARERLVPSERAAFLQEACGDDVALRKQVESLLIAHDRTGEFLQPCLRIPPQLGDYELLEEIARGGMGVVYRARQISLNRLVAVKMILAGQRADKQDILRFRAEAEAAANLHHPNIVAIHETGEHAGCHYFSMEYVAGRSLSQIVREDGPLAVKRAVRYAHIVAEAIGFAHEQGTLHRDIKPSNILIDASDQPRITDFGLAKRVHGDYGLTVTGQVLGTPHYMPPEQCGIENKNRRNDSGGNGGRRARAGPWSDVYGIGATLYFLLTGRPPFQAESLEEVFSLLFSDTEPVSPRSPNPSIPKDLDTLVLKCLSKSIAGRYQTARELAEELGRFAKGEPIRGRPVSSVVKVGRWCRRKPALATALLLAGLAVGATVFMAHRLRVKDARYQSERRHTVMEKAWLAAWGGDINAAEMSIREAELAGASVSEVRMLRGVLASQRGDYTEAIQHLEQAARLARESVAAQSLLSLAYCRTGQFEKAHRAILFATERHATNQEDLLFIALAQSEWGDSDQAQATLELACRQHPGVLARLIRAQINITRGAFRSDLEYAKAIVVDAAAAKALLPSNALALAVSLSSHIVLAAAYDHNGRLLERASTLTEAAQEAAALSQHSNNVEALWGRHLYYQYVNDPIAALQVLQEGVLRCDNSMLHSLYAIGLYAQGKYEDSLRALDRSGQGGGAATDLFRGYVLVEMTNGPARVFQETQRLMQQHPPVLHVLYYQSALRLAGHSAAAAELCGRYREKREEFPVRQEWYERLLDFCSDRLGSEELFRLARSSEESQIEAHFFAGMRCLGAGMRDEAAQHFSRLTTKRGVYSFDQYWARAFLSRLQKEPDWPRWIPARGASLERTPP